MLVADDQELVRAGFCVILEAAEGISVVGEASNGADAVAAVAAHHPDVVLMDIRMPGMDGLEATRLITQGGPDAGPRVVMLTTFDLDDYVYEALRSGASGFLLKDAPRARPDRRGPGRGGGQRAARPLGDPAAHRVLRAPPGRGRARARPGWPP